jgi:hypothetical protein
MSSLHLCDGLGLLLLGTGHLGVLIGLALELLLLTLLGELALGLGELLLLLLGELEERLLHGGLEVVVVGADNAVGVVNGEGTHVGHGLDLEGYSLDLLIGHFQTELLGTRLDGIPASQARGEVDVAAHAEVLRVDNLVCRRVVEDGLGVDTGLVGEGAEAGDVVVEGNVDLDGLSNKILERLQLLELVLGLDVVAVGDDHAGHEATKRSNTVALTNSNDGGVDVGSTGLEGAVCVGNGAASVVVEVGLDVAADDAAKSSDEIVDLSGSCAAGARSVKVVEDVEKSWLALTQRCQQYRLCAHRPCRRRCRW